MKNLVLYLHGKGGSARESEHYKPLFPGCEVLGLDYRGTLPWEAGPEIRAAVEKFKKEYDSITLVANSIGAWFAMAAGIGELIERAYFISPIVDMERLILDMLGWAGASEEELQAKGEIPTAFGETLSWDYLSYVRQHPLRWGAPTRVLCGSGDSLTSRETMEAFARAHAADLTVMEGGEHWFHTPEQMAFLDAWVLQGQVLSVNGEGWRLLRLLGKGKGGYSYLAEREGRQAVLKQIHHEPCDYYAFGDKLESERRDYERLRRAGIPIPRMLDIDAAAERILKEYIPGSTVAERMAAGESVEAWLPRLRELAETAETAGLNIDYYPTNFVPREGELWYVDYECNDYMEQWDLEHWGIKTWLPAAFSPYADGDYEALCLFLNRLNREDPRYLHWNWGRLEWMIEHPEFDKSLRSSIGLWKSGERIVGAAIFDMYFGEASCAALPAYAWLYPEILDYAWRELRDGEGLAIAIPEGCEEERRTARAAGFLPEERSETVLRLELPGYVPRALPEGFSWAELDPGEDLERFQWLLWQGFDHGNDREAFLREDPIEARRRPHFDPRLSLVALAPGGEDAAYCCLWYREDTDFAYVEPVCTVPAYRGRGLAGALLGQAFLRARELGAKTAYVLSDMDFYQKLGFVRAQRALFYRKTEEQ